MKCNEPKFTQLVSFLGIELFIVLNLFGLLTLDTYNKSLLAGYKLTNYSCHDVYLFLGTWGPRALVFINFF